MNSRDSDDISIVIVSYNTEEFLRRCLSSLYDSPSPLVREVIVVDNASTDGSVEMVESEFPRVTLVKNRSNLGYAAAVNRGLARAAAPYFLILNPDIETGAGPIRALRDFMEANPEAGIVGGKLLYPDGTLQMSCRTFYSLPVVLLRRTFLGRLFPNSGLVRQHLMLDWDHDSDRQVDWVNGACMMVRREAYENVGGMDERFFLYLEDVDWCYRMKKHGWKVYYVHSAPMTHHCRRESAGPVPGRTLVSHLFSTLRFYDKWGSGVYALKRERRAVSLVGKVLIDVLMLNLAFLIAYYFRSAISDILTKPLYTIVIYRSFIIFINVVCLIAFLYSGLYKRSRRGSFARDIVDISRALFLSWIVIMASTYLTRTIGYSRFVIIVFLPLSTILVTAARALQRSMHVRLRRGRFDLHRAVVVGLDREAVEMGNELASAENGSIDFVGYVIPAGRTPDRAMGPVVGTTDRIGRLVVEHRISQVLVAERDLGREEMGLIVTAARRNGAEVKVASEMTDMLIRGSSLGDIAGIPVVVFPPASLTGPRLLTKRLSDYIWALIGVVGLSLLAPVVVAVRTAKGGDYSVISRSYRLLGAVLAGKRSLVGPMAPVGGESLEPGVTGMWHAAADRPVGVKQDRLDMYYIQNWSLSMDLEIIVSSMTRLSCLFGSARTPEK